ncbi:titin-like [Zophobas morio]|uniref:titin-like n=1 Tax=Zophobas morio TaxID=2755281 RepID=UPI0030839979
MTDVSCIILASVFATLTFATKLTIYPKQVIKDQPVTFVCEAEPPSSTVTYKWLRNGNTIGTLTSSKWTIERASLDTRSNFSCIVETKNGSISRADIFVNVTARPGFIKKLRPYYGFSDKNTNVSLTCRIECYPLCNILWYKDDKKIDIDNPLYYLKNDTLPANYGTNDFESVESTLVWNLKNWPNQRLIKNDSQSQYSCKSDTSFGDVESATYFAVEYAPENITLSTKTVLNIIENETPDPVTCTAKGNPEVDYVWKHTPTGVVKATTQTLRLDELSRDQEHNYTCQASNKHGITTTELYFNILYKPSCFIELDKLDNEDVLICKADGNPNDFRFNWKLDSSEEDLKDVVIHADFHSYLVLNSTRPNLTNYQCQVRNSVGVGNPCNRTILSKPFQIDISGVSNSVKEGAEVVLRCDVTTTLMVQINWYKNSKLLKNTIATTFSNKSGIIISSSFLRFTASRTDSYARLKCSATNKILEKYGIPLEKTIRLEVVYKPVVRVSSNETTFVDGKNQTAVLLCKYFAHPISPVTASWLKNGAVLRRMNGKYTFVTQRTLSLIIANVTKEDIGDYRCVLSNSVGETASGSLSLDVLHSPDVVVTMTSSFPSVAFFRTENIKIILSCKVISGNPLSLSKINWFVNDSLLEDYISHKLYQPQVGKVLLSNDSRVVTLVDVSENYVNNFTCQGVNKVGPGPKSEPLEVKISYPDIPTKIIQHPESVFKGDKVTLECSIDADVPSNVTYFWLKDNRLLDIHTSKWTIKQATLELRRNISCFATSDKRTSIPATISAKILARASFLSRLKPYTGVLKSGRFVSLTCRVECYPICAILWLTKGQVIIPDALYDISTQVHAADFVRNDFESVESTLTFSSNEIQDDTLYTYSCRSVSPTLYDPDVSASTVLALEYPPEDIKVSEVFVEVEENHVPKIVKCEGKGKPLLITCGEKHPQNG